MAWYGLRMKSPAPSEAARFRMEQGQIAGASARELFPDGVLVSRTHGKTPAQLTQEILAQKSIPTLFEAEFATGRFVAKADILEREASGWHVLEVKSSFSDTSKKKLVDDLAYTVMVLKRTGLSVTKASLVLLSRNYRFGDGPERLFEIIDKTGDAQTRVAEFDGVADAVALRLLADVPPSAVLSSCCRKCRLFAEECLGAGLAHTVLEIPSLHYKKLTQLSDAGIVNLEELPADFKLNDRQRRACDATLSGTVTVNPELATALATIEWPCHYLDFETVATVLPLYNGHGCHRQVLTQFSVHHRGGLEEEVRHSEYLADASRDCERELALALIDALGGRGSIIIYSSFEQTRINELRDALPNLDQPLKAISDRLIDLYKVVGDYIYHPLFKGSFSIKKVLPALVPTLSYEKFAVADGDTAITKFARMARGDINGADVQTTRQQLLDYCKMDTLAMVQLHETLCGLGSTRTIAAGASFSGGPDV